MAMMPLRYESRFVYGRFLDSTRYLALVRDYAWWKENSEQVWRWANDTQCKMLMINTTVEFETEADMMLFKLTWTN